MLLKKQNEGFLYRFVKPNFLHTDFPESKLAKIDWGFVPYQKNLESDLYQNYFLPFVVMVKHLTKADFDKLANYRVSTNFCS